jgi:ribosome-binding ATPase YchF (GTP1/OBG family)
MAELPPDELTAFLEDYGLEESGMVRLIRSTYRLLGLISFLTAGEEECRAWTIRRGTKAQQAAGVIHSDLEKHFIRAEVASFDDFRTHGGFAALRDKGLLRLEGKEYEVKDGDILTIRHSG